MDSEEELPGAELARRCFVTLQKMNGILVGLESAGMVECRPHPTHGRVIQARLTQSGADLLARTHERVTAVEERMVSGLSEDGQRELLLALRNCTVALEPGA